ncbi:MAG TPA: SusC/RagA family TonB-linked outer membrane protein [Pseudobacter sp.]|nr:SusC/RagA family TonB-linked outer membrane protein [Pseudobacter sp.]
MDNLTMQAGTKWKKIPFLLCLVFAGYFASAQVTISGKVTDAKKEIVPGISVQVKNTSYGTSSDANGSYTLQANLKPGSYTIEFSGVGFKAISKTLQVGTESRYTVDAELQPDAMGMDEVIVTGTSAGTTRKQLGNYISTVKAEDLTKGATGNVLAALQGKTAGAQISQNSGDPAGGISVRLRGISSISSGSEPLYIVDGIIVNNATTRVTNTSSNYDGGNFIGSIGQNRMVDINPADIERVEVLNGAAAAAIYGSRANAGVVQIFTKRGKSGAPQVNFSTNVMMNQLRKKLDVNQSPTKFGPLNLTQDVIATGRRPGTTIDTLATLLTPVNRYDYQDYIFHTGIGTDNNVSVSGGNDKTKYFFSGSYFYNQGIVKNTDFQRFSFRSNIDQTLNKWLSVNLGLNYVNSKANEKPDGNSFFSPVNSITIIGNFHDLWTRDPNGNLLAVGERGRVNPVSVIEDMKQQQQTSRVLSNITLKAKPFKNFTIDYTMGIDNYTQNGTTFIPPYSYNVNTAFWGGGFPINDSLNGYASAASNTFFQINHEINATYTTNITEDIGSTTQLGYSVQYEKNTFVLAQGRGLSPLMQTVRGASTLLTPGDERSELSISGTYLQQNFRYRNHLFVTGAARLDGSSVFGEDERNQLYVKASGSYVMSSTDYWSKLGVSNWWDLLKFRIAYGQSGNLTGIGAYQRFNFYSSNAFLGKTSLTGDPVLANTAVKPERQSELEVGLDLGFFNNRLGLQANWYHKKVNDLLISRFVAPTTGYSSLLDNIGFLENNGIELVLTGSPVRKKDFDWNVTAIFNRNRNKVKNVGGGLILLSTNSGTPVAIIEGQPVGVFYGSFFARDNNGNPITNKDGILQIEKGTQNGTLSYTPGRNADGLPTGPTTLRKVIGNPNPDWTGSLVNEISYKNFGLRVQVDAVQGVDVWNADWRTRQGVGSGLVAQDEQMGKLPRGYVNGAYAVEEWRVDDGSFVKLREVSLSYRIGQLKMFKDLTVSLSGRNLVSFDNYKGYDPEVNAAGQSTVLRGIDFGTVPIPRTFSFGIQAKF